MPTTMTADENKQIAQTIANQIGHLTLLRVNARKMSFSKNDLTFRVGNPRGRIKAIRVILEPSDTYTVEYFELIGSGVKLGQKVVSQVVENVYCEQLSDIVISMTFKYDIS